MQRLVWGQCGCGEGPLGGGRKGDADCLSNFSPAFVRHLRIHGPHTHLKYVHPARSGAIVGDPQLSTPRHLLLKKGKITATSPADPRRSPSLRSPAATRLSTLWPKRRDLSLSFSVCAFSLLSLFRLSCFRRRALLFRQGMQRCLPWTGGLLLAGELTASVFFERVDMYVNQQGQLSDSNRRITDPSVGSSKRVYQVWKGNNVWSLL